MTYDELREKYFSHVQRNYINWDTFFKNEVEDKRIRDYLRVEAAYLKAMDIFTLVSSIEDTEFFEEFIGSTHDKADELSSELGDADRSLAEVIGKELLNAHLSAISQ